MGVHSKQLATSTGIGTGDATIYTVPAGIRTIVKSAVLNNGFAGANYMVFTVKRSGSDRAYMTLYVTANGAPGDCLIQRLWLVLETGDSLHAFCAHSSISLALSGAELTI